MTKFATSARALRPELLPNFVRQVGSPVEPGRHPGPETVHSLIEDACALGASDIHMNPHHDGTRVRVRVDGTVWDVAHLSLEQGRLLVNQFKALANLDPITRFNPRDAHASVRISDRPVHLRLALAPTLDRETVTVRILDPKRLDRSIRELGFSDESFKALTSWMDAVTGMFIASGPTSSGKTTTLYALLRQLKEANRVIVSLEDPVEYQIDGISQVQIDELHHLQFADGVKALLRHDPDCVMIGEIRDALTARAAVSAAIAGRILLSTVHARDCVGAVTALRNWELSDHEIAESVSVVAAQRLVRKLCLDCCQRRDLTPGERVWFENMELQPPAHLWSGVGCNHCRQLGSSRSGRPRSRPSPARHSRARPARGVCARSWSTR